MPQHRKERKFRRTGQHAAPSQVGTVAQKAGKAVPTVAMVSALAVAPQVHKHASPGPAPVAGQVIDSPREAAAVPTRLVRPASLMSPARLMRAAHPKSRTDSPRAYTVQPGDTLSGLAFRFYGQARDWRWLYQVNRSKIKTPNLIYPGQVLHVPHEVPGSFRASRPDGATDHDGEAAGHPRHAGGSGSGNHRPRLTSAVLGGTLGCHGLEALWRSAGGAPSAAVTAASIAMAESGGKQYATGWAGERGYWQINPVNGAFSTYNAHGNARSAVIMSHDGTDWSAWTTYVDGAYAGRC